ncbi:GrpB family protein [Rhizobium leguminosarum bv. viciae]|uniref:GrpB family protein n=1 Tax=Rhizobium leguminosarum TaxID=384 RepID=UPI00103DE8F0|nr:GrpB family protein [Rhizobium leguminosarum]TBY68958.1 GrpB family protein [Rhizobium leguminosarum bv. viciae]
MTSNELIVICDWSAEWAEKFRTKAAVIREALGTHAKRIDHIGSTAIRGLAAKPIIDIQVSVAAFDPLDSLVEPLKAIGYVWRSANSELTKQYFRESPGQERTHIHVRRLGSWHEQWPLLFRDYMRLHVEEHEPYVDLKRSLAAQFQNDRAAYTTGKEDHLWQIIRRADRWAAATGWTPVVSDA